MSERRYGESSKAGGDVSMKLVGFEVRMSEDGSCELESGGRESAGAKKR